MAVAAALAGGSASYVPIDPEWAIGDAALLAVSTGDNLHAVKTAAARTARRDPMEVSYFVRVCEAFPPATRHPALTYAHHHAVLPLLPEERVRLLNDAEECGWSARTLRGEVRKRLVASGVRTTLDDDDPEDAAFRKLARAWNHAPITARESLSGSIDYTGLADILL